MRTRTRTAAARPRASVARMTERTIDWVDGEIRLITPTDPEGVEHEAKVSTNPPPSGRHYQLTHDYLIPSLREWLTRKQKETRRGRAELILDERAAAWSAKPHQRNLPTWREHLQIRAFTKRGAWTEAQKRMMQASSRSQVLWWGLCLVLSCLLGLSATFYRARLRRENDERHLLSLIDVVITTDADAVPRAIENLKPFQELARPFLHNRLNDAAKRTPERLHAAFALAEFGEVETEFLVRNVATATDGECPNIVRALSGSRNVAVNLLHEYSEAASVSKDDKARARMAIVAMHLGDPRAAIDLCAIADNPTPRRLFEEALVAWNAGLQDIADQVDRADDATLRAAMCLGLGRFSPENMPDEERRTATQFLRASYQYSPDPGTHSAARWALRQWNFELPELDDAKHPSDSRNWYINTVGMTMLRLPAGRFRMGNEKEFEAKPIDVTLTKGFYLADREVNVQQFQQFIDDPGLAMSDKPENWKGHDTRDSPTPTHPVQRVNWYDAILYCNWLSRREGRTACYKRTGSKEKSALDNSEYDAWRRNPDADGYRLPTEAEWEYACRAGTTTDFSHGNDEELLRQYAVYAAPGPAQCGSRKPNGWGLFDMNGNVWEWCGDSYGNMLPGGKDPEASVQAFSRVLRGGGWSFDGGYCRSALRNRYEPVDRYDFLGFRVAATQLSP